MILLCQLCIIFLLLKAVKHWLRYRSREPDKKTARILHRTISQKKALKEKISEQFLMPPAKKIAYFIPVSDAKNDEMKRKLTRAGINLTPKEYYARAIVAGAECLFLLPFTIIIGAPVMTPICVLLAALVAYHYFSQCQDALKNKKKEIERELPTFIRAILYKLNQTGTVTVDLISIFEDYLKIASSTFSYDISILVMELKTRSADIALRNLASRVGIVEVSFLCNALTGITRGEHQERALESLARDMDVKARENIKRELEKRPQKVTNASLPLVGVGFVTVFYILIVSVIQNMGNIL